MNKLSFSGHESFACRQFWLKKGIDFIDTDTRFSDNHAVIDLGVGKNMVSSIRFWLKSFGLIDEKDSDQEITKYLFSKNGADPYLEDFGTIWLLHYFLVKTSRASIYNLVFNEFRKERIEFNKDQLHSFLKRKCEEVSPRAYNTQTIYKDISVFLRNYLKPQRGEKLEIEDDFTNVLIDLDLLQQTKQRNSAGKLIDWYKIESGERADLSYQIVLFSILDNPDYKNSITFKELQIGSNSPGLIFALNAEGLYQKIKLIEEHYPAINYSETAGNQVLQFKTKPDKWDILDDYYGI